MNGSVQLYCSKVDRGVRSDARITSELDIWWGMLCVLNKSEA